MVALIGIMMGLYVLARCAEMAESRNAGAIVKSLAVLAFLGNLLGMVLLFSGVNTPGTVGVR